MFKKCSLIIFLAFLIFLFNPLNSQCVLINKNIKIKNPYIDYFVPYSWNESQPLCNYKITYCIYDKLKCPSNKAVEYFPSITNFTFSKNWIYTPEMIKETILKNTISIMPFIFYFDKPLPRDTFFNMKTTFSEGGLLPYYIPNNKSLKMLSKLFIFQYTDNLSECHSRFCLVPSTKPYSIILQNNSSLKIVNDTLILREDNQTLLYLEFNEKKCLNDFLYFFKKGDPLAFSLFKAHLLDKNCSVRGYGNFFIQLFDITETSFQFICEKKTQYETCYYIDLQNPLNKIQRIPPKNLTNPLLIYDLKNKNFSLAYNISDIFVGNPKIVYNPNYYTIVINPTNKLESINITYYNSLFHPTKLSLEDGFIVYFFRNENPYLKLKEKFRNNTGNTLSYSKTENIFYSPLVCTYKNGSLKCEDIKNIKDIIRKYFIKNNTLFIYFNQPTIVNGDLYFLNPFKIKLDNNSLIILEKKVAKYLDLNNSLLFYTHYIIYNVSNDLLKELFLNGTLRKVSLEKVRIQHLKYQKNDYIHEIYIFPKDIIGSISIGNNNTINLSRVYKVEILKPLETKNYLMLVSLFIIFIILCIPLVIYKLSKKNKKN